MSYDDWKTACPEGDDRPVEPPPYAETLRQLRGAKGAVERAAKALPAKRYRAVLTLLAGEIALVTEALESRTKDKRATSDHFDDKSTTPNYAEDKR